MQVVRFETLESTNVEASKNCYKHGDIVVADFQTNGKGQRGNVWVSQSGQNLMMSLVLELQVEVAKQYSISMLAALSAMDAICSLGLECKIKWSNDLYVGENKIGGILIEHNSMGEFVCKSVIGIGINVKQVEFDAGVPNPTSFALEGIAVEVEELLNAFLEAVEKRLGESFDKMHSDFMNALWRKNGFYPFKDSVGIFNATIIAVDKNTGELILLDEQGVKRNYWFKEVEFVLGTKL